MQGFGTGVGKDPYLLSGSFLGRAIRERAEGWQIRRGSAPQSSRHWVCHQHHEMVPRKEVAALASKQQFYFAPQMVGAGSGQKAMNSTVGKVFLSCKPFSASRALYFTQEGGNLGKRRCKTTHARLNAAMAAKFMSLSKQIFQLCFLFLPKVCCFKWVFPKIGVPQNGWFVMENSLKWMIWGYHYFRKHPNVYLQPPRRRFLVEPQVVMYPEGTRNVSLEAFRRRVGPGLNTR